MNKLIALSLLAIPFTFTACAAMPKPQNPNNIAQTQSLSGKWIIVSMNNKPVVQNNRTANIEFENGRVFGAGFCNRYFGQLTGTYPNIKFGPIGATRMACMEDDLMALETEFHNMLGDVTLAEQKNGSLYFKNSSGNIIAEFRKPNLVPTKPAFRKMPKRGREYPPASARTHNYRL